MENVTFKYMYIQNKIVSDIVIINKIYTNNYRIEVLNGVLYYTFKIK